MLAGATHAHKVNFCKFTNETRNGIEDASAASGLKTICVINGTAAGGGYELALAADHIMLVDDGASAVSLPELPLLAVLPGTGGLTRVTDKRKVRRDHADVFCTTEEGIKGKRAVEWKLVDAAAPRSKFGDAVRERATRLAALSTAEPGAGVTLEPLAPEISADGARYKYVELAIDRARRTATITMRGPDQDISGVDAIVAAGSSWWPLRAFRELDDALLRLRFNHEDIGLLLMKTRGDRELMLKCDAELDARKSHWFVHETVLHMARVLRRLDMTARSIFAILDPESCFVGSMLELALAADRRYMLDDPKRPVHVQASKMNGHTLPTANDLSRLDMLGIEEELPGLEKKALDANEANEAGLVTVLADELDFDDTLRLAIEERASLSPDALTGMEASFRCVGPETMQTKIFGRLSAWQNWIFTRPNATGERGALSLYGKPERPSFDWRRT
jgi:benzoyl-CoA-dihydrodiol lyase